MPKKANDHEQTRQARTSGAAGSVRGRPGSGARGDCIDAAVVRKMGMHCGLFKGTAKYSSETVNGR
ncbi:MAG: hypothetical protein WBA66_02475 [Xanthobacteraceae bacterium]